MGIGGCAGAFQRKQAAFKMHHDCSSDTVNSPPQPLIEASIPKRVSNSAKEVTHTTDVNKEVAESGFA